VKKNAGLIPLAAIVMSVTGFFAACASAPQQQAPEFSEALWAEEIAAEDSSLLYAPHVREDGTFFNPWLPSSSQPRPSGGRGFFFREKKRFGDFPEENYARQESDYSYLKDKNFDSISFAGHASAIIKMNGETVFTDPFFSDTAVIVAKKVKIKFDFDKVPRRPVVVISHNHYDHMDTYSIEELIKKDAVFLVPLKLKRAFEILGAKEVYELDWWESVKIGELTYTFLPVQHWSRRIGQKRNAVLWGSWLIRGSRTVYFSGDTGYFCGFAEYGRRFNIDYALIGAGAYEPRWFMHYSHMNVAEFIKTAADLRAGLAIPVHFGVISLSDEPLLYPLYELDEYLKKNPAEAGRFRPLRVGEYLRMEG
jgi:L-ascorbate metabolism protein UlaG (beta-lactamase superfamily)